MYAPSRPSALQRGAELSVFDDGGKGFEKMKAEMVYSDPKLAAREPFIGGKRVVYDPSNEHSDWSGMVSRRPCRRNLVGRAQMETIERTADGIVGREDSRFTKSCKKRFHATESNQTWIGPSPETPYMTTTQAAMLGQESESQKKRGGKRLFINSQPVPSVTQPETVSMPITYQSNTLIGYRAPELSTKGPRMLDRAALALVDHFESPPPISSTASHSRGIIAENLASRPPGYTGLRRF